ncbi:hypothetical protein OEZ85_004505 [Tetradesmus obliquus]|uniref:Secreted protein n=1 Tax=Tetradesmus obliquus TaxID=3088 RepID=A0ABY8UPG3_TETOB|nr:hypothetical protein OEZ85_004505 [Tetradesmus obliquus]
MRSKTRYAFLFTPFFSRACACLIVFFLGISCALGRKAGLTEPGAAVLPEPAAGTSQSHILQSNLQTACGQTTVTPVLGCRGAPMWSTACWTTTNSHTVGFNIKSTSARLARCTSQRGW